MESAPAWVISCLLIKLRIFVTTQPPILKIILKNQCDKNIKEITAESSSFVALYKSIGYRI
jgi:hypothetical protein